MMQVPLGILPKNEVSYDDMLDVFNMLSRGGDQLTAARARGAVLIWENTHSSWMDYTAMHMLKFA